jgi:hypothetical protein
MGVNFETLVNEYCAWHGLSADRVRAGRAIHTRGARVHLQADAAGNAWLVCALPLPTTLDPQRLWRALLALNLARPAPQAPRFGLTGRPPRATAAVEVPPEAAAPSILVHHVALFAARCRGWRAHLVASVAKPPARPTTLAASAALQIRAGRLPAMS